MYFIAWIHLLKGGSNWDRRAEENKWENVGANEFVPRSRAMVNLKADREPYRVDSC